MIKKHWFIHIMALSLLVAWLCLTLCDPVDCSPPGSSIHGIFQARILEWISISSSRGYHGTSPMVTQRY